MGCLGVWDTYLRHDHRVTMKAKERHRLKLLAYMGDPELPFPDRGELPGIVGIRKQNLYKHFTTVELSEIEAEAVEIRKAACSRQRARVLEALYQRAVGFSHPETKLNVVDNVLVKTELTKVYPPDKAAAQEFLDRTEGKVIEKKEITGKDGAPIESKSTLEAGPGIQGVLRALGRAATGTEDNRNEGGNKK